MKILYFDCATGISGNMAIGALLEICDGEQYLRDELAKLEVPGYQLNVIKRDSHGIDGTYVEVLEANTGIPVDAIHDGNKNVGSSATLGLHHGHTHSHHHELDSSPEHHSHGHYHDHNHDHSLDNHCHNHQDDNDNNHNHNYVHRTYADIKQIIEGSGITEAAKELSRSMFQKVAAAEAAVHGKPIDEVHFHEVGAIDSIVDIVSVAILMDYIKPDRVISSVVSDGYGTIKCAHGVLSVPVPATSMIYKNEHIIFKQIEVPTELVTPTGAAIISTFAESYGLMPEMNLNKIGIGVGSRNIGGPNTLRVFLGEDVTAEGETQNGDIIVVNSNIDDSSGEDLGYVLEKLMDAGALDVSYAPIFMKKNRPAYRLEVICRAETREKLSEIIFDETTTIGVRYYPVQREELTRVRTLVDTELGQIEAKQVSTISGHTYTYPEYESMKSIASELGISMKSVRATFGKGLRD
nr:nickel pincer cofactor biosynthesis protein LarC [uncultured Mogibacterium sp.]